MPAETPDTTADLTLAQEAGKGSLRAMEDLVHRHQTRLYRFLLARTQDQWTAEELVQDAFVIAWRKIHRYNPRYAFTTWLFTIANRLAASEWRKHRPSTTQVPEIEDSSPGPVDVTLKKEARENLWTTARKMLTDSQYAALWMHYGEDMPIREIAGTLRKTIPGVKLLLFRGRRRMAEVLEKPVTAANASGINPALSTS